MDIVFYTKQQ